MLTVGVRFRVFPCFFFSWVPILKDSSHKSFKGSDSSAARFFRRSAGTPSGPQAESDGKSEIWRMIYSCDRRKFSSELWFLISGSGKSGSLNRWNWRVKIAINWAELLLKGISNCLRINKDSVRGINQHTWIGLNLREGFRIRIKVLWIACYSPQIGVICLWNI